MQRVVLALLVAASCLGATRSLSRRRPPVLSSSSVVAVRGGGGSPEEPPWPRRVKGMVARLKRFAKRLYARLVLGEDAAPPPENEPQRRRKGPTSAASRKATRIARELAEFRRSPPEGCALAVGKNLNVWVITLTGAPGTVFDGEKYKLRVAFPADYPASPPSVYFLQPTPRHPHVYTNGDICLSLLGEGWSPNLTVPKLALSILSMLSSTKHKGVPQDNANHCNNPPGKPQEGWMYHDDSA